VQKDEQQESSIKEVKYMFF